MSPSHDFDAVEASPADLMAVVRALTPELKAAYDARGFAGIVELMRAHSDDMAWQLTGCFHLTALTRTRDAESAARAGDAGAVEAVFAALHSTSAHVASVQALFSLVEHCEPNRTRACADGAAAALVALMTTLLNPAAVRYCALALAFVAGHDDNSLSSAVAAGAMPALVAALHSTSHTAAAFHGVLRAVHHLLSNKEACASLLYAADVLEVLVAGLRAYPTHVEIQRVACKLLYLLLCDAELDAEQSDMLRRSGTVDAVVAAMRSHPADTEVQIGGCYSLSAVRKRIELPERWFEYSGYLDVVLAAMRTHRTSRTLQMAGCVALGSELRAASAADRDRAVAVGAFAAVLAAWPMLSTDELAVCADVLYHMLRDDARRIDAAVSAGISELMLTTLRAHPAASTLHFNAYVLLGTLLATGGLEPNVALARRLLAAGALQFALRPGGPDSEPRATFAACLQAVADEAEHAAERAAAELLAAEGVGPAAASKKKKSRSKKKGGAAAVDGAGASGGGADAASESAAGVAVGDAVDDAAALAAPPAAAPPASEPSTAAVRRRRRAATKATRRAGGRTPAAAEVDGDTSDEDTPAAQFEPDAPAAIPDAAAAAAMVHAHADAAVSAGAEEETPAQQRIDAALVASEAATAAAAVPMHAHADDAAGAAAGDAQLLGDIFPWLRIAPVPAAAAVVPVLPPLPLHAQPPPPPAPPQQTALELENAAMAAEVARLRAEADASKCPICLDAPKCTVLLPCRHLALCGAPTCYAMLGAPPLCPLCRKAVADTMQLFV